MCGAFFDNTCYTGVWSLFKRIRNRKSEHEQLCRKTLIRLEILLTWKDTVLTALKVKHTNQSATECVGVKS